MPNPNDALTAHPEGAGDAAGPPPPEPVAVAVAAINEAVTQGTDPDQRVTVSPVEEAEPARPRANPQARCSPTLWDQIQNTPDARMVRGLIRAEFNLVLPADAITTAAITEFLATSLPPDPATVSGGITIEDQAPVPINLRTPAAAPTPQPDTVIEAEDDDDGGEAVLVRFTYDEAVSGRTRFTRTDRVSATIDVPVEVVRRGARAVNNWIANNFSESERVDTLHHGDEDHHDSEDTDSDFDGVVTAEVDVGSLETFNRDNPDNQLNPL